MRIQLKPLFAGLCGVVLLACADEIGGGPPQLGEAGVALGEGDAGFDGGMFGNAHPGTGNLPDGAVASSDASPTADAFFINDPAPMYCGPDAGPGNQGPPGGTPLCPGDKNREGCPCPTEGMQAACWPGKRVNRNHGICKDGMTVCERSPEFGLRWGACEGYVLPKENATVGPEACGCFSSGTWALENLAPCIFRAPSGKTYLYSSRLTADGSLDCGSNQPEPPPAFPGDWSANTLNIDCAGEFDLCFTIKAGDVDNPQPDDCEIMQHCLHVWYPEAGVAQELTPIPAWSSPNTSCAQEFDQSGGYGEMTVLGKSIECDIVDDGKGNPYVFHRTDYCPPSCQEMPDAPGCKECKVGGSGMFGP